MKKILSLLTAVILTGTLLIGCTADETELWNSYAKSGACKSNAVDMTLKITTDTGKVNDPTVLSILSLINGMVIDVKGNAINDPDNGIMKVGAEMTMTYLGHSYNYNIWEDFNLSDKENPQYKIIYEFPKGIWQMDQEYPLQYYTLSSSELNNINGSMGSDLTNSSLIDSKAVYDLLSKLDTAGLNAQKKDGVYAVTLKKESFIPLFKQYLELFVNDSSLGLPEGLDMKAVIDSMLDPYTKIDLLGGKDLSANITLDKDGYLSNLNSKIDLLIDPVQISSAFGEENTMPPDPYGISLDLNCNYSDYNQINSIDFPTLTEENSASLLPDLSTYETTTPTIPPIDLNGGITVIVNGKGVDFDVPPQVKDGRTMVPMRNIFEALGAQVNYDGNTSTITATYEDKVITHTIGENIVYVNGEPQEMDTASYVSDGRTFVPARFMAQAVGATVAWDQISQTVFILTDDYNPDLTEF